MDNPRFKRIKEAISEADFIDEYEDYNVGAELIDEISNLIFEYFEKKYESSRFRQDANKKHRNKLTDRISKNAGSLAIEFWKMLENQTLRDEFINLYSKTNSECSLQGVVESLGFDASNIGEDKLSKFENYQITPLRDYTDIFWLVASLTNISEAASRTNKEGFKISTNRHTGLDELSKAINKKLKILANADGEEIKRISRATIISEIFVSVDIKAPDPVSIYKNIS